MRSKATILFITLICSNLNSQDCRLDSIISVLIPDGFIKEYFTYSSEDDYKILQISIYGGKEQMRVEKEYIDSKLRSSLTRNETLSETSEYEYDLEGRLISRKRSDSFTNVSVETITYLGTTEKWLTRKVIETSAGDTISVHTTTNEYDADERLIRNIDVVYERHDTVYFGNQERLYEGDTIIWVKQEVSHAGLLDIQSIKKYRTLWEDRFNDTIIRTIEVKSYDLDTSLLTENEYRVIEWGSDIEEDRLNGGNLRITMDMNGHERLIGTFFEREEKTSGYLWRELKVDGYLRLGNWKEEINNLSTTEYEVDVEFNDKGLIWTENDDRARRTYYYSEATSVEQVEWPNRPTVITELDKSKRYFRINGQEISGTRSTELLIEFGFDKGSSRMVLYVRE